MNMINNQFIDSFIYRLKHLKEVVKNLQKKVDDVKETAKKELIELESIDRKDKENKKKIKELKRLLKTLKKNKL